MKHIKYLIVTAVVLLALACSNKMSVLVPEHMCKRGYQCVPSMGTTDYIMIGGCYPDSVANRMIKGFYKSLCLCGGFGSLTSTHSYSRTPIWNDTTGCRFEETFEILKDGNWVKVSKEEFEKK